MENNTKELIKEAVKRLIRNTTSDKKILSIIKKHKKKIHFVPIRYRVLGGLLQSLNIQFGNYIEELIHLIVENENNLEIISKYSGKKNIGIHIDSKTDNLIDNYITQCQTSFKLSELDNDFNTLLDNIYKNENENENSQKKQIKVVHDIDVLFMDKTSGIYYYIEVKYNDDHDTGKFVDINRKFIKTYAGLINELNISKKENFIPILYYLNQKIMKGNIYLPEEQNIYRGSKLFDKFFSISYTELDEYMHKIGSDNDIVNLFDQLYNQIRFDYDI